ncbi:FAD-binding oxidoreductase [Pseudidiomarina sp.]|uniref:NAD(P)/FAD-dependent oxidoreductase n=1 Tax=Pseudidiomarina sp. TaxID=2081707 RepID=UPI00299DA923|nr:FAD-binding oxidoreductase [Pseudidiomarina sp.]MDX1705290.1 FAD-binding oxidoreductase [Pseudidiomarina sp.]
MYDPLHDACPGPGQPATASYWQQHSQPHWPETATDLPERADVVVIGAGYTGLNAALELSERYQQQVVVLEANQPGWGCSTRNAGFAMPGTGRLGYAAWAARCGTEIAMGIRDEYRHAFDRLERHVLACPQQAQLQRGGYLKIAHKPGAAAPLYQQYQQLCAFEPDTRWLERDAVQRRVSSPQACAAIHFPQSFGVNPLLVAASVARQAVAAGSRILPDTPVTGWQQEGADQLLQTTRGSIRAARVILATNGYTPNHLHPAVHGRSLPVLSSVLVTRPLTASELAATGLSPAELIMDTRLLKYYFRLLPDGRLLFGGRGAIHGKDADKPRYARHLLQALAATFPALKDLAGEQPAYFWSGWISVALDEYPRVYSPASGIFTSMGYCGAGLTFSQLAGARVAQLAMGETLPALPFYQSPLPRFPLPGLRRLGQRLYYQYARWRTGL